MRAMLTVAAGVTAVFGLLLALIVFGLSGGSPSALAAAPTCATSGPLRGLSAVAAQNARVIVAVAEPSGGDRAAVIAVMVADTESGLRVLGNTSVASPGLPVQGTGSNADSLGLFQQRASWGTVAQRLDPQLSTRLFLNRLLALPGWASEPAWVAAQQVQASAWDGRARVANDFSAVVGGNYQEHVALARRIVAAVDVSAARLDCGALTGGLPASTVPGARGLPADYTIPASATPAETRVITFALDQLDKPYVFGAAGPNAYDCSGLVMAAWATVGVLLPHDADAQSQIGTATTVAAMAPGDLLFVPGDDGTLAAPGHVGLYLGHGLVIDAADQQLGIRVQTVTNFISVGHGLAGIRHLT